MNAVAPTAAEPGALQLFVRRAADMLASAATAAEVLDARDHAALIYDAAKRAARLARAKGAHDEVVAAAYRAQADALEIESLAKRRLADEYDAAQARGEVAKGRPKSVPGENTFQATAEEIGLTRKQIFDARQIRDAVVQDPGVVRRVLDDMLANGDEPTRAAVRRLVVEPLRANLRAAIGTDSATAEERGNNLYETPAEATRALLALESFRIDVWEPACGRGAISRLLEDAGYEVFLSDLVDYGTADRHGEVQRVDSFLDVGPDYWLPDGPRQGGADIITNPPYGQVLNAFVARALRVHRPRKMALLLNLNFLCGFDDPDRNFAMDDNPPARILIFTRRLPMMHREGWAGPKAESRMNTAWFVWEQDADGCYAGPTTVHRVDWKEFEEAPAREPAVRTQSAEAAADSPPVSLASVTEDELTEYKALSAIDAGVTIAGPIIVDIGRRGLAVFGDGELSRDVLTAEGQVRLLELERRVSAASDGDAVTIARKSAGPTADAALRAPRLPPAPLKETVEYTVGGMRKTAYAWFGVSPRADGTFAISGRYEVVGLQDGHFGPEGRFDSFAAALRAGLSAMRDGLGAAAELPSATAKQHTALKHGLAWIERQADVWGLALGEVPA